MENIDTPHRQIRPDFASRVELVFLRNEASISNASR